MQDRTSIYVEQVDGAYRLVGTRIGLDCVVHAYLDGQSPEAIQDNYPSLPLETIHGAIAFYLHNRADVDRYLTRLATRMDEVRQTSEVENSALLARLRKERRQTPAS